MKKILAYGIYLDKNLGGPSIVHGLTQILGDVDPECQIVLYHLRSAGNFKSITDSLVVKELPTSIRSLFFNFLKRKLFFNRLNNNSRIAEFWRDFDSSDVVVNLYGICFCDKLNGSYGGSINFLRVINDVVSRFALNLIARICGKRSVKCTASYGPINHRRTAFSAHLASRFFFDLMVAREHESYKQMRSVITDDNKLYFAPDIANAMPCNRKGDGVNSGVAGISVSFQIIKQWGGDKTAYYKCMRALISRMLEFGIKDVKLIPNELKYGNVLDDYTVATEIKMMFPDNEKVSVYDAESHTALEMKDVIAGCEVLVASRYHSCVAALSACVPVLVIGWHYKYQELMDLYGQQEWLFSTEDCDPDDLVKKFEIFWNKRDELRKVINEKSTSVLNLVYESGKRILGV